MKDHINLIQNVLCIRAEKMYLAHHSSQIWEITSTSSSMPLQMNTGHASQRLSRRCSGCQWLSHRDWPKQRKLDQRLLRRDRLKQRKLDPQVSCHYRPLCPG